MIYRGNCPVCGSNELDKVYQEFHRDYVVAVYLCEYHEITVEWGNPVISEVRGVGGDTIPKSEWDHA